MVNQRHSALTRREILFQTALAGATILAGRIKTTFAMASQPTTRVDFDVPRGACDCHTHIFGDRHRFPFFAGRTYTPESASVAEQEKMHRALHVDRTVIVQPSVYGTDNSCTLDALRQIGPNARGIAVIGGQTTVTQLDDMHRRGIRGIRINLETSGIEDPAVAKQRFRAAVEVVKRRHNWHIQIYTSLGLIAALRDEIAGSSVPVVFDHFGGAQAADGPHQPGLGELIALVESGKAYVKLSAPYRVSKLAPDFPDVAPLAKALVAANSQRMLWGTDWPHPQTKAGRPAEEVTPLYQIDDGRDLNLFAKWVPNATTRKTILVDNPARLYGF
ncbi:MAG: amidohydrolase family protein [Candidatus Acidiferrales bacterium]